MKNKKLVNAMCIAMGITMLGSMSAEATQITADTTYTANTTVTDATRYLVYPLAGVGSTTTITINSGATLTATETYYGSCYGSYASGKNIKYNSTDWSGKLVISAENTKAVDPNDGTATGMWVEASGTNAATTDINGLKELTVTGKAVTTGTQAGAYGTSVQQNSTLTIGTDKTTINALGLGVATGMRNAGSATEAAKTEFTYGDVYINATTDAGNDLKYGEAKGIANGVIDKFEFNNKGQSVYITAKNSGTKEFGYAYGIYNQGTIDTNTSLDNFEVKAIGAQNGSIALYNGVDALAKFNMLAQNVTLDATASTATEYRGAAYGIYNKNGDATINAYDTVKINAWAEFTASQGVRAEKGNVNINGDKAVDITAFNKNANATGARVSGQSKLNITGKDIEVSAESNAAFATGIETVSFAKLAIDSDTTVKISAIGHGGKDNNSTGLDLHNNAELGGENKITAKQDIDIVTKADDAEANSIYQKGTAKLEITTQGDVNINATTNSGGWYTYANAIRDVSTSDLNITAANIKATASGQGGDVRGIRGDEGTGGNINLTATDDITIKASNDGYGVEAIKLANRTFVASANTFVALAEKTGTAGNSGTGVALDGGTFDLSAISNNIKIEGKSVQNNAYGIDAWNNATIKLGGTNTDVSITANNNGTGSTDIAQGLRLNGANAEVLGNNFTTEAIVTSGDSAKGAHVENATLNANVTNYSTTARGTNGNRAEGLFATGAASNVNISNANTITMTADTNGADSRAFGLNVENGANVTLNPLATATVSFTANNTNSGTARGIKAINGGTIDLGTSDKLDVTATNVAAGTAGDTTNTYGMDIWSTALKGTANTVAINATSPTDVAIGTKTFGTGSIDLKGNDSLEINATGDSAYSIWSSTSATNDYQAANLKLKAESTGNVALAVRNDIGTVNVTSPNGEIIANTTASGKEAIGVYSMAISPANPAITNIEGINKITATSADPDMNYAFYASTNTGVENATINYNAANVAGANIVEGNIFANDNGIVNANFNGATSTLTGWAQDSKNAGNPGQVNIGLKDKATWVYEVNQAGDNNSVTALNSDDGIVDMTNVTGYQTLEVGTLTGANGLFKIDTDLASNTNGDKIFIDNSTTATQQYMQVTDTSLHTGTPAEGKLLVAKDYSSTMSFLPKDLFSGGLWVNTPELVGLKDDPSNPGLTNWYLLTIKKSLTEDVNVMKNAYEAGFRTLMIDEDDTLLKRLGDLRNGTRDGAGVWARMYRSKFGGDNYDKNSSTVQVGIDKEVKGKNGSWIYGLAGGHTTGDMSYKLGQGNNNVTTGALYATNYKNDGQYLDLVLRRSKLNADLKTFGTAPDSGNYSTWGTTVSAEYGKRFKQKAAGTFVEPQVQLSWGHMNGVSYLSDTGINVGMDAVNSLVGRLGFVAGRQLKDSNYYFKANAFHEFSGNGGWNVLAANGETALGDSHFGGTWYELGVGANVQLSRNTDFHFDLEKGFGGDVKKKYQVTAGMRWAF